MVLTRRTGGRARRLGVAIGAFVCAISGAGFAHAEAASVSYSVRCVDGQGVIDVALHNLGTQTLSTFRVTDPASGQTVEYDVQPGETYATAVTSARDGSVNVGVTADGTDASFSVTVACGGVTPPVTCPPGSAAHDGACVASAASASGSSRQVAASPRQLPATGLGTATGGLWLGAVLVGCGTVASLASRRHHD